MGQMLGKEGDLPLEPSLRVGTVKALIKAPLKNYYVPQRRLVRSKKLLRTLTGALFREAPSN